MNELKVGQYRQDDRGFIVRVLKINNDYNGHSIIHFIYHTQNRYGVDTDSKGTFSSSHLKKHYHLVLNGYNTPLYKAINGSQDDIKS